MLRYEIREPKGIDGIIRTEVAEPLPGPGEVQVEMRAWSLNYRDLSMPRGGYPRNDKVLRAPPLVPLSDGAGVVVAVGPGVTRLAVGTRVVGNFLQAWIDGPIRPEYMPTALGGSVDGLLAERVVLPEDGWVRFPDYLSFEEAATLPCAGLTAWAALSEAGLKAGDTVLALGTGGVSIFALQLAKAAGAQAIVTSSSDAKLDRVRALGADITVNYEKNPDWDIEVLRATGGRGADNVIEIGGPGTYERSLRAARVGGTVSLIGLASKPPEQNPSPLPAMFNRITVRGIYVGSRSQLEELMRAMTVVKLRPVIDRTFGFDEVREAFRYLKNAGHVGKIVVQR
jgi:NADPH:quinone reductase-like Zn-dependent oxidoreductase